MFLCFYFNTYKALKSVQSIVLGIRNDCIQSSGQCSEVELLCKDLLDKMNGEK